MFLTTKLKQPLAITMWDFSWLERRWAGAGYEDWDKALDELKERGYDGVRIDAYPHFVAADPHKTWEIFPFWNQNMWGSPALNHVVLQPNLNIFIEKCAERGIWVGLSSWFSRDVDNVRLALTTPEAMADVWKATLASIDKAGLLDSILFVDLCNEFPYSIWIPAFDPDGKTPRHDPRGVTYMDESIELVRAAYPTLDYCYSFSFASGEPWVTQEVASFDFLENHIWMVQWTDFYDQIGYHYSQFDTSSYENLVKNGEKLYRSKPEYWQAALKHGIELNAEWSRQINKPLITTECWGIVDYKDFPLLDWGWVKELCEFGVDEALKTRRWLGMGTSNFCGPQFVGMWRDVAWHQKLTDKIRSAPNDWL
jgi:hypothetical protein